jgi:hypothetical protein
MEPEVQPGVIVVPVQMDEFGNYHIDMSPGE